MSATTNPSFAQSFVVLGYLTALSGQVSDDEWSRVRGPRWRDASGGHASSRLPSLPAFVCAKNRTAYRFRDKSVLRSLTRAYDRSPIATAVRAVFTDMPPGKYSDT